LRPQSGILASKKLNFHRVDEVLFRQFRPLFRPKPGFSSFPHIPEIAISGQNCSFLQLVNFASRENRAQKSSISPLNRPFLPFFWPFSARNRVQLRPSAVV